MSCTNESYLRLIDSIASTIINNFTSSFLNNKYPGNCRSIAIIKSGQTVIIDEDAEIVGCTINISNRQTLLREDLCIDIPNILKNMSPSEFSSMISSVINSSIQSQSGLNNPTFVNELKSALNKLLLKQIEDTSTSTCNQYIYAGQNQEVIINGKMRCDSGSSLNISNNTLVKSYISCIVEPVISDLKNNIILCDLFQPDKDCVYSETQLTNCDGNSYVAKINILKEKRGKGKCDYIDGQQIKKQCSLPQCNVSEWSEWSECYLKDGQGIKSRTRKFLTSGVGCDKFNTIEFSNCDMPPKFRSRPILQSDNSSTWIDKINNIDSKYLIIYIVIILMLVLILYIM